MPVVNVEVVGMFDSQQTLAFPQKPQRIPQHISSNIQEIPRMFDLFDFNILQPKPRGGSPTSPPKDWTHRPMLGALEIAATTSGPSPCAVGNPLVAEKTRWQKSAFKCSKQFWSPVWIDTSKNWQTILVFVVRYVQSALEQRGNHYSASNVQSRDYWIRGRTFKRFLILSQRSRRRLTPAFFLFSSLRSSFFGHDFIPLLFWVSSRSSRRCYYYCLYDFSLHFLPHVLPTLPPRFLPFSSCLCSSVLIMLISFLSYVCPCFPSDFLPCSLPAFFLILFPCPPTLPYSQGGAWNWFQFSAPMPSCALSCLKCLEAIRKEKLFDFRMAFDGISAILLPCRHTAPNQASTAQLSPLQHRQCAKLCNYSLPVSSLCFSLFLSFSNLYCLLLLFHLFPRYFLFAMFSIDFAIFPWWPMWVVRRPMWGWVCEAETMWGWVWMWWSKNVRLGECKVEKMSDWEDMNKFCQCSE